MPNLLLFNLKTDADDNVLGFTSDWIRALAGKFDNIFVLTMEMGRINLPDNVKVFSVGKEKGYGEARRGIEFYRLLVRIVHRNRIDFCFAHMTPLFAVMAWPVLKSLRKPILLWYAHKSVTPMLRLSEKLVDRIVTCTRTGFQIESSKVSHIGHGVDVDRFVPAETIRTEESHSIPFRILTLGRLSPIKRVEILIEAVAQMKRSSPLANLRLTIAGGSGSPADEAYLRHLKALAESQGIADITHFSGSIGFGEVHQYYHDSDAFVNMSDTESLDKSLLEAMSSCIPIVSSNLGLKEILIGSQTEICLVERDHFQLSQRLQLLIKMGAEARRDLGFRLREIVVTGHSLSTLSEKLSDEFARLQSAV